MTTSEILNQLKNNKLFFAGVIAHIDSLFNHKPTAFVNGLQHNDEDQNQGSAKVLSFAKLENLSKEDTLLLFAEHYQAVLNSPQGIDHQNIRQFMQNGWDKVIFDGIALTRK